MSTPKRSFLSYIPGYSKNAVLQLIVVCGTAYVGFHFIEAIMLMIGMPEQKFFSSVLAYVALPSTPYFLSRFWTVFTYAWVHMGFWELVTNMIWLYTFGNLVQVMIGYKQVRPLFIYSILAGGAFYLLCQFIPGSAFLGKSYLLGCQAGVMGMAVAAITIAPTYRFYLGDRLTIPISVVAGIFAFLMLMNTQLSMALIFVLIGGGLTGFIYVRLLQKGYKPGAWMYSAYEALERTVTPNEHAAWKKNSKKRNDVLRKLYEPKQGISQKNIDELLDKIIQKGYNSLSKEEKDTLMRAGKDD